MGAECEGVYMDVTKIVNACNAEINTTEEIGPKCAEALKILFDPSQSYSKKNEQHYKNMTQGLTPVAVSHLDAVRNRFLNQRYISKFQEILKDLIANHGRINNPSLSIGGFGTLKQAKETLDEYIRYLNIMDNTLIFFGFSEECKKGCEIDVQGLYRLTFDVGKAAFGTQMKNQLLFIHSRTHLPLPPTADTFNFAQSTVEFSVTPFAQGTSFIVDRNALRESLIALRDSIVVEEK